MSMKPNLMTPNPMMPGNLMSNGMIPGNPMMGNPMMGNPMMGNPMMGNPMMAGNMMNNNMMGNNMMGNNMMSQSNKPATLNNYPMESNMRYWTPHNGRILDTEVGVNSYNIPPVTPYGFGLPMQYDEKIIKEFVKKSRHFWLENDWTGLFNYVIEDGGKARLVKNESEYKLQKKNKYSAFDLKADFLRENFVKKDKIKNIVLEYVRVNPIPSDLYEYENVLKSHIKHEIKRKIVKAVKKNM